MKTILISILLFAATQSSGALACGKIIPKLESPPHLIAFQQPHWGFGKHAVTTDLNVDQGYAKVLLDLNHSGKIKNIEIIEIHPADLPLAPIRRAIERAMFTPHRIGHQSKAVTDFEFTFELELTTDI